MPMSWVEQWVSDGPQHRELVQMETSNRPPTRCRSATASAACASWPTDWREFVENMSVVEGHARGSCRHLRRDGLRTRDSYRHVVEKVARLSGASENEVAARGSWRGRSDRDPATTIPRRVLPGRRRRGADASGAGRIGFEPPAGALRPQRIPLSAYLAPIAAITGLFAWGLLSESSGMRQHAVPLWLLAALALLAFSELGIALVNWLATVLVAPRPLPRMDFSKGIPIDPLPWSWCLACSAASRAWTAWWRGWKFASWPIATANPGEAARDARQRARPDLDLYGRRDGRDGDRGEVKLESGRQHPGRSELRP